MESFHGYYQRLSRSPEEYFHVIENFDGDGVVKKNVFYQLQCNVIRIT